MTTAATADLKLETKESWEKYLNQKWEEIKESSVWSSISESTGSAWNTSMAQLDELADLIKKTNNKEMI